MFTCPFSNFYSSSVWCMLPALMKEGQSHSKPEHHKVMGGTLPECHFAKSTFLKHPHSEHYKVTNETLPEYHFAKSPFMKHPHYYLFCHTLAVILSLLTAKLFGAINCF